MTKTITGAREAEDFRKRISTWHELLELIEHFSYYCGHDWLFRGVTDENHLLIPKIGRKTTRAKKKVPSKGERVRLPHRIEDERAVFSMFKQQARAYLSTLPENDIEWLSLAQHFGLPTRLLDWTDGLLIAAWFAVEKGGVGESDCAIWVTKNVPCLDMNYSGEVFTLNEARVYRPPHINSRIASQGSVFMLCPCPTRTLDLTFVAKIIIERSAQFTIKKRLHACGINRRHLFPDLGGLSDHLAWLYKNDWLAGYKQINSQEDEPDER